MISCLNFKADGVAFILDFYFTFMMQVIGRDCVYYFHDMIVEMIKWGFQEGKTLFGFGYDFRQSNRYLINAILLKFDRRNLLSLY